MALELVAVFLGFAVPMVISPGPGNTVLALSGARFGVRGTGLFWLGFEIGNVLLCLLYGLGFGALLLEYPQSHTLMLWAGAVYVLYLAWGFFRSAAPGAKPQTVERMGLVSGIVAVLLNVKIHSMVAVMFAQFLQPDRALAPQVLLLTGAFLLVGIVCHFPWIYGGQLILGRFTSDQALRIQGRVFGGLMVAVAVHMLWV
ncbi:LysE family translocator [Ectopseudomonas khazarica]|uniref:LysE family translocator n=1 Tax=Ectopseudomonas khazarica TaxID=2502979 RepID=UPI003B955CE7